jgi:Tfp pilus assembly protein PilF
MAHQISAGLKIMNCIKKMVLSYYRYKIFKGSSLWLLLIIFSMAYGCYYNKPAVTKTEPPPAWLLRIQGVKQPDSNGKEISSKAAQDLYLLGMNYYQRGLYQPAIEKLISAVEQDKDFLPPYVALGDIYQLTKQPYRAEENYKQALSLDPSLVEARVGLGIVYWERNEYELAYDQLSAALELQPKQPKAQQYLKQVEQKLAQEYLKQGIACRKSGQWELALEKLQSANRHDPQLGEVYLELGRLYIEQQQYQPAIDNLQDALGIMPEEASVWNCMGQAYLGLYEYDKARKALQRCLILDPGDREGERLLKLVQQELYRDRPVPAEFLKISSTPAITRGQLAALLALNLRLPRWENLNSLETPVIIPDISSHWAREYIIYVVKNRLMSSFPSRYFNPEATVSRGELADIIDKILQRLDKAGALEHKYGRLNNKDYYTDVPHENQYYGAISRLSQLDIISHSQLGETFGLTREVSGLEALEIIDRLADFISL